MSSFYELIKMSLPITHIFLKDEYGCIDRVIIEFEGGIYAVFSVNIDTDEFMYETKYNLDREAYVDACSMFPELKRIIGKVAAYACIMTNDGGYRDAFQLEFSTIGTNRIALQARITASNSEFLIAEAMSSCV